jgi:hypothetical protein
MSEPIGWDESPASKYAGRRIWTVELLDPTIVVHERDNERVLIARWGLKIYRKDTTVLFIPYERVLSVETSLAP